MRRRSEICKDRDNLGRYSKATFWRVLEKLRIRNVGAQRLLRNGPPAVLSPSRSGTISWYSAATDEPRDAYTPGTEIGFVGISSL